MYTPSGFPVILAALCTVPWRVAHVFLWISTSRGSLHLCLSSHYLFLESLLRSRSLLLRSTVAAADPGAGSICPHQLDRYQILHPQLRKRSVNDTWPISTASCTHHTFVHWDPWGANCPQQCQEETSVLVVESRVGGWYKYSPLVVSDHIFQNLINFYITWPIQHLWKLYSSPLLLI